VNALLQTVGVAPTRIQTIGKDATRRCFEILRILVPFLCVPAAQHANTTALLTPKVIRQAMLPHVGGRRTVEHLQHLPYGEVRSTGRFRS
jgi:hypothetical protein